MGILLCNLLLEQLLRGVDHFLLAVVIKKGLVISKKMRSKNVLQQNLSWFGKEELSRVQIDSVPKNQMVFCRLHDNPLHKEGARIVVLAGMSNVLQGSTEYQPGTFNPRLFYLQSTILHYSSIWCIFIQPELLSIQSINHFV